MPRPSACCGSCIRGARSWPPTRAGLRLADAQLALARAYDFSSWPKLREHLRLVEPWRRNPHQLGEQTDPADELLRLACLTYGADARTRPAQAAAAAR